ncbi:DegT/DnrJ/EryC1/StrS family aminotransferase [Roseimaritima ulvae]|uniref:UDP-2-acetamido-2-deoxy-3-oxo-D-glucuronate aminotransferase n=1 Tax=Roseimaritima ulvae TaxID=980254 RepID=A0A5B9QLG0_9BACT|nr:DegT/DnrJ/EryC1/StrS family aminotransferase [Roseimaritima ulvae]QEG38642.1 UDP-2-acetamido-2-deoxy-3-oxo-D-glucuronate aminotransferase [Roseimaritima ulvae]
MGGTFSGVTHGNEVRADSTSAFPSHFLRTSQPQPLPFLDGGATHVGHRFIMQFIDLQTQYVSYQDEIDARMRQVMEHGRFIMGPEINELEQQLCEFTASKHCLTVSSGTTSLEIALRALGIGPGDEVITVPFTWISSAEVILLVGATPVFVDIDPATFNIDLGKLEAAITPNTKAILPVCLFGQMPDFNRLNVIAAQYGVPVIEDAAQSFGATQEGKRSCNMSTVGSTSFFPAKPLGCYGDGGALFTDDDELAAAMKAIRTHGGSRHHHTLVGTNGRFDTLQAAVILAKLPHFQNEVDARGRIGARYSEALRDVCQVPEVAAGNTHVYAQYTIRVPKRDELAKKLSEAGIPTAVYYPKCLHEQPVFETLGYKLGDFPNSEAASREVLSLPMHPFLSHQDQDKIIAALRSSLHASLV